MICQISCFWVRSNKLVWNYTISWHTSDQITPIRNIIRISKIHAYFFFSFYPTNFLKFLPETEHFSLQIAFKLRYFEFPDNSNSIYWTIVSCKWSLIYSFVFTNFKLYVAVIAVLFWITMKCTKANLPFILHLFFL